jgi:hypothetical protein
MEEATSIEKRAGEPEERIASLPGACPACSLSILPGDRIASSPATGTGWRHLKCAICQKCGAWLAADGSCSSDCGAVQAEPEQSAWLDISCTTSLPERAIRLLSPSSSVKLLHCRILAVTKVARPQPATTMAAVRVHLQILIKDAPNPGRDTVTREVAKAIGTLIGNVYDGVEIWRVNEVGYDMGAVEIEDERRLTRAPAWAAQ